MSSKINLQYPYSEDYICGYLNINKEPRTVLLLIRKDKTKTSVSYARYLMSCHLKRYLTKTEHVDHIDNNKLNDVIDNLQILTPKENNIKKNEVLGIKLANEVSLNCPVCGVEFSRPSRNVKHKLKKGKEICCSRRCGGIKSHQING